MIDIYNIIFFYYSIDNFFFQFRKNLKIKSKISLERFNYFKKKFVNIF